jgi:hypothetical protein
LRSIPILMLLFCYSPTFAVRTVDVIPLSSEPHHHLAFHNRYVNVYQVQVVPPDSVLLHRHDFDAISVMLSDAQVTVSTPGQPEARRKLTAGQIRLQSRGYVHSTAVEGDSPYRNVTVELLLPQDGERNGCSAVIPGKPLNCPAAKAAAGNTSTDQVQFESNQSTVNLVRVSAHQDMALGHPQDPQLVVALDPDLTTEPGTANTGKPLDPGQFVWLEGARAPESVRNNGDKQARIVVFTFHPQ